MSLTAEEAAKLSEERKRIQDKKEELELARIINYTDERIKDAIGRGSREIVFFYNDMDTKLSCNRTLVSDHMLPKLATYYRELGYTVLLRIEGSPQDCIRW